MGMSISDRRSAYADEYRERWAACKVDPERAREAGRVADIMISNQGRYEHISELASGGVIPWWFIALAHNRESGMDFTRHLHEGSRLTGRTQDVPKGRPKAPPTNGKSYTFEESAVDALTMPGKAFDKIKVWDVAEVFFRLELYNGFGYRAKGIPSPYLWAGTNQSDERGKYVRDHVFDPNAVERQLGCAAIMLELRDRGVVLFSDGEHEGQAGGVTSGKLSVGSSGWEVGAVQRRLSSLGYHVGKVDERFGPQTRAAVLDFQARNGLLETGEVDASTREALGSAAPREVSTDRSEATADDLRKAGSTTVAAADKVTLLGRITMWLGIGGTASAGADAAGLSDTIKTATDQVGALKDLAASLASLGHWALAHWWVIALAAGIAAWWFGRDIIAARVADHRSGAHLGR